MATTMNIDFVWIPPDLGGHRSQPYVGMRPTIRWQRHLREHVERARDVECTSVAFDPATSRGSATVQLSAPDPVPSEWLREGNLIELLDGYRVIAIGRITTAPTSAA